MAKKKKRPYDKEPEGPYTVKELITFLKTCDPKAVVFYTHGGSNNNSPVNYVLKDTDCYEISEEDSNGKGGVLLGDMTW